LLISKARFPMSHHSLIPIRPAISRAVITGATGFIGSHLVSALASQGCEVYAITRRASGWPWAPHSRVHVLRHDPSAPALGKALEVAAGEETVVFHLAGHYVPEHSARDIAPLVLGNILFGTQLLDALHANGIRHLVTAGTSWEHFGPPQDEPVCLYAATKKAFRVLVDYFCAAHALNAITLMLYDVYGPCDPRPKLIPTLQRSVSNRTPIDLSPGEQAVDLLYIDDAIDAFLHAATQLLGGDPSGQSEVFVLRSGRIITLRELVAFLEEILAHPVPVRWGKRAYRTREVMTPWNGGTTLPGWAPKIALEEGLRRTVQGG
jgi:nucleoside-diphosphate-sugar epimerase